ncbi:ribonuclease Oy [Ostrinia furnacalis]|uniref:ribonuclease Oy n=1 Tax=Ostrinia furnacalis TaxID=93504 RepID=UPI00103B91C4|nr:ribonuclease Oy [Ostrinia furnacalis]
MNWILFVFVVLYVSVENARLTQGYHHNNEQDWDILIFTQQWPETVCKEWIHNKPSHSCVMPKQPDSWSIHGVWPTKFGTKGPGFCNRTWLFDPEQVKPIETQLLEKWTNIEGNTGEYSLWAHEWNKHGTCAAVLEPLNSELKYFSQGLSWGETYSMSTILANSGIIPDDEKLYTLTAIHNVLVVSLGVNPSIQCRHEDGKTYLVEIRVCFDKNLTLHDCDGIDRNIDVEGYGNIISNCNPAEGILYPHNKWPQKRIYVQLYKLVSWVQWLTL